MFLLFSFSVFRKVHSAALFQKPSLHCVHLRKQQEKHRIYAYLFEWICISYYIPHWSQRSVSFFAPTKAQGKPERKRLGPGKRGTFYHTIITQTHIRVGDHPRIPFPEGAGKTPAATALANGVLVWPVITDQESASLFTEVRFKNTGSGFYYHRALALFLVLHANFSRFEEKGWTW